MPRPTTIRPSGQSYAPQQGRTAPGLTPVAPLNVSDAHSKVAALAQSLGIVNEIAKSAFQEVEERRYQAAVATATVGGKLDEKLLKKSLAYQRGAAVATAKRRFAEDESELLSKYDNEFDRDSGTLPELNAFIDSFLSERYSELDDAYVARELLPQMAALREGLVKRHTETQRALVHDKAQSDYAVIASAELSKSGTLDVSALHAQMLPVLGGAETSETLASILANEAITRGRPELLDLVPERWADGTPTFARSPRFDDYLRGARQAAENQRDHLMRISEAQEAKQAQQERIEAERSLTIHALEGNDVRSYALQFLREGKLTGADAREAVTFARTLARVDEAEAVDYTGIGLLEGSIYEGEVSRVDIMRAWNEGRFGTGKVARQELTRLLSLQERDDDEKFRTPEARTFADDIRAKFNPMTSGIYDPNVAHIRNAKLRAFYARLEADQSPAQAYEAAIGVGPQPTAQARPANPSETVKAFYLGRASRDSLLSAVPSIRALKEMRSSEVITAEEYDRALEELAKE